MLTIRIRQALLGLGVLLLVACALQPSSDPSAIVTSPQDSREYRYLELNNRLRVILVSDDQADKAAAALRVNVGSGNNPMHRQGLAHFLEHMLFLGTEKYPDVDEFGNFINDHGGSQNAGTALDYTVYFFDIDPDYLDEGLDRFAQFFIAPLFNREYVDREMHAVDSEYKLRVKDDGRREGDVFRELVNPEHPLAMLGVGNLQTLEGGDTDIREDLLEFYDAHYSANLMTLVVFGRQDLDSLEAMVQRFAAVPDRDRKEKQTAPPMFVDGSLPMQVNIEPVQERRELTMLFTVPPGREHWATKPQNYIGELLGHEGPGSLLSVLKQLGWAESVGALMGGDTYEESMFQLKFALTEAGLENYQRVVGLAFDAIDQVRASGVEEWRFREQGDVAAQSFRFMERSNPVGTAMFLSAAAQDLPVTELIRGRFAMTDYDPRLIAEVLDAMRPENLHLTLSYQGTETDRLSKWYDAPYRVQSLDADTIRSWRDPQLAAALVLPRPNPFIAQRLDLLPATDGGSQVPEVLQSEPGFRFWYRADDHFAVPRASLHARVLSPAVGADVRGAVLNQLFLNMVADELNETTYYALLAGLQFSLRANSRGFDIRIAGYNDKQQVLLERILGVLRQPSLEPDRFDNIRTEMLRGLANADKQEPRIQLSRRLPQMLFQPRWSEQERLDALQQVDREELQAFAARLLRDVRIEALVFGNVSRPEAGQLSAALHAGLFAPGTGEVLLPLRVVRLPQGPGLSVEMAVDHPDSGFLMYLQGRDDSLRERADMLLLNQIIGTPFFDRLRTEQQLGYVVGAYPYPLYRIPGLALLVQSPKAGPDGLQQAVETFFQQIVAELESLDEQVFERHRQAVILSLTERPRTLQEQAERYWVDVSLQHFGFDDRERLAQVVAESDLAAWQQFLAETLAVAARRAITLSSVGSATGGSGPAALDPALPLARFRQSMEAWEYQPGLDELEALQP